MAAIARMRTIVLDCPDPHALARQNVRREHHTAVDSAQPIASINQLLDRQLEVCLWLRHRVG